MGHPEATLVMVGHDRTLVSLPRGVYCTLHFWPDPVAQTLGKSNMAMFDDQGAFQMFFLKVNQDLNTGLVTILAFSFHRTSQDSMKSSLHSWCGCGFVL